MRPARRASQPASTARRMLRAMATGIVRPVDRGGHEDAVAAQLHGQRRVRRRPDAGVEDHRARRPTGGAGRCCAGCGCPGRCRSANRAASPRRNRPAGGGRPAPGRRSCRAGRRTRPRPAAPPRPAARPRRAASVRSFPITSSLTQSVPNASRASLAVRTASDAVAHPAVFGRTRMPSSSRSDSSEPRREGSTRRTATVARPGPRLLERGAAGRAGWSSRPCRAAAADRSISPAMQSGSGASALATSSRGGVVTRTTLPPAPAYGGSVPDTPTPPTALTIAGSDSGGGAGIAGGPQDLRRAPRPRHERAHRRDGAEHDRGPRRRGPRAGRSCGSRSRRSSTTSTVRSVKTGMLANAGIVAEVACLAEQGRLPNLVVDPVLVSSTGHPLVEPDGVAAYLERLLAPGAGGHPEPARGRRAGRHDGRGARSARRAGRRGRADSGNGAPAGWW